MNAPDLNPFAPSATPGRRLGRIGLFVVAAAAAVAAVVWWSGRGQSSTPAGHDMASMAAPAAGEAKPVTLAPSDQQRIGVTFAPVTETPMARTVRVVGLVKEDETRARTITARVDGFVERLDVDFTGQLVRAGEPLLGLYAPDVVAAQTELLLALELERAVSAADPEAKASASRAVAAGRQRMQQWNVPDDVVARVEQTGTVERVVPLRSPYDGFVIEKSVLLGQRIMAGQPLYRLADLDVVWVEGEMFEQDLPLVRLGATVRATFQALPGVERSGRVTYVYPTVDPATRTARIRVELPNRDMRLKPGMYGLLQFEGRPMAGLTVPRSAILATGTRNLVFVKLTDGRFEPREVVLGASTPERIQVLRGLALGDTVVASGTFLLDAESNLGSLLGGMGDMPGMDIGPPKAAPRRPDSVAKPPVPPMDHSQHEGR
ncbi:MAG TPA: efflux RND transporter periplasmic adaptor subunit [Gemmatimonadales bacterium]